MTRYCFISYMHQKGASVGYGSGLYKAVDKTLHEIRKAIAGLEGCEADSVVITHLQFLTKKEFEMLRYGSHE